MVVLLQQLRKVAVQAEELKKMTAKNTAPPKNSVLEDSNPFPGLFSGMEEKEIGSIVRWMMTCGDMCAETWRELHNAMRQEEAETFFAVLNADKALGGHIAEMLTEAASSKEEEVEV